LPVASTYRTWFAAGEPGLRVLRTHRSTDSLRPTSRTDSNVFVTSASNSKPGPEPGFRRGLRYGVIASSVFWLVLALVLVRLL